MYIYKFLINVIVLTFDWVWISFGWWWFRVDIIFNYLLHTYCSKWNKCKSQL